MSPIAATRPAATVTLMPVMVRSRFIDAVFEPLSSDLAIEELKILGESIEFAQVSVDRLDFVGRKNLAPQPGSTEPAEKIGMRTTRREMRMQDGMDLVLDPRAMADDLVATRYKAPHALCLGRRRPDFRQKSAAWRLARTPASILSVFTWAWAIALTCSGLAMTTRVTNGVRTRTTAIVLPVASTTTSSLACRVLPNPSNAVRVISTRPSSTNRPLFPDDDLRQGAVNVHSDHSPHDRLLRSRREQVGDTTTTDSRSRRNRASRRGGQLLTRTRGSSHRTACPHLRAPGASVPDGRTIRRNHRIPAGKSAPEIFIPDTNAIKSLNAKLRRAVRTRGHFPTDDAAMKLLYLVLRQVAGEWKMPPRERCEAKTRLAIMFDERLVTA